MNSFTYVFLNCEVNSEVYLCMKYVILEYEVKSALNWILMILLLMEFSDVERHGSGQFNNLSDLCDGYHVTETKNYVW